MSKQKARGRAETSGPELRSLVVTQLHKVSLARHELAARGFDVVSVRGGGPWLIVYRERG